ncbi:hypothetical protein M422DRAFT_267139 [Sphaerobolus stellatus SS14]|uniref:Uncharacterized protein n=1 Tax=Sphaerobolus stellatus (strain SS14) TaxID=990650 RepID=A0A0C9U9I9_SPHS4|nr:hypothetical protein M422DRAFT_267139 [Sphaerobolus stellatus SS14]
MIANIGPFDLDVRTISSVRTNPFSRIFDILSHFSGLEILNVTSRCNYYGNDLNAFKAFALNITPRPQNSLLCVITFWNSSVAYWNSLDVVWEFELYVPSHWYVDYFTPEGLAMGGEILTESWKTWE